MAILSLDAVRELLVPRRPPCLSLFMPTHRRPPDNCVDRPQFSRLVDELEASLSTDHRRDEVQRLLAPYRALERDHLFWQHVLDGLAVLASDGTAEIFRARRPFQQRIVVAGRFHTLPLLRLASEMDHFDVLALGSRRAVAYSGTLEGLDPVAIDSAEPQRGLSREDVIDQEAFQPHRVRTSVGVGRTLHGGFGSRQDDIDADTERFFREVDAAVLEHLSQRDGLPMMLVALAEHASLFRRISKNPLLLDEGVDRDPTRLSEGDLCRLVSPLVAARRQRRVGRLLTAHTAALEVDPGAGDPAEIARAVVAGRVATLLVEQDRFEEGRFNRATGEIAWGAALQRHSGLETCSDLFCTLAEEVLLHGGDVFSLSKLEMPNENGVAAIWRFSSASL